MVEITLSILAVLLILALAWIGPDLGVFYELTTTLLLFLAMMVALRYWYGLTQWLVLRMPDYPAYVAFGAYWTLFLVGCLPLIVIMNRVTESSVPRYPRFVDRVLGLALGAVSGLILVSCLMTSLSVITPKVWPPYDHDALLWPVDRIPIAVYQKVEGDFLGIRTNDVRHTRFPTFQKSDADQLDRYWQ